jgi:hypothetical protein
MESIHARTQRLGGAIQFASVSRLEGPLRRDLVLGAWKRLFDSHPLLRARIVDDHFELTTPFDAIPISFKTRSVIDPFSEMSRELAKALPSADYLFRVVFVSATSTDEHYLILTVHHAMADATAAASLVRQFVDVYNLLAAGGAAQGIERYELREAVEQSLPDAFCRTQPLASAPAPAPWPVEHLVEPGAREQLLIQKVVGTEELERLLSACRRNDVKLTGLLCVAVFRSLESIRAKLDPDDRTAKRLMIKVPRNVRPLCRQAFSPNELGDYITMPSVTYESTCSTAAETPRLSPDIWPSARDFMRQYLQDPVVFRVNLSAHVDPIIDFVGQTTTPFFRHGPILSNMGRIDTKTRVGPLSFKSFDFAIRNAPINGSLALAISTYHDQMSCLFNFNTPLIRPGTAQRFVADFASVLRYAAS